jgi:predicted esterase
MTTSQLTRMLQIAAVLLSPTVAGAADKLPVLAADPARTSISGLSSGAFMAVQYDVSYSNTTLGIGVLAYNCAFVNVGGIATCTQGIPVGFASYEAARGFAALGQIDPVENLAKTKVYLFSGTNDTVVKQSVVDSVRDFYTLANVSAANLVYVNNVASGHAFISPSFGNLCATNASPFVNKCVVGNGGLYDQPGAILTQIPAVNLFRRHPETGGLTRERSCFVALNCACMIEMARNCSECRAKLPC